MNRFTWRGWLVCLAVLVAAPAFADTMVTVGNFFFDPKEVFITTGEMVEWMNIEGLHSTTSDDGFWDSGAMPAPWDYQVEFDGPGDYPYYCVVHGAPGGIGQAGIVHVMPPQRRHPMLEGMPLEAPISP